MTKEEINVHIGEVKTGSGSQILRALLGSCVGVAILWPERNIYGLAHCLLSESPNEKFQFGAKYVDQAIHSLIELMNVSQKDYKKISAVVAGGGNMTKPIDTDDDELVGERNSQSAINTLSKLRIHIIHKETGGINGRRISIDCMTGSFEIQKIPRPEVT